MLTCKFPPNNFFFFLGIMVYSAYDAYQQGVKDDLFIKDISGGYYLGQVWPGPTYFPDFFHPKSQDYWTDQLKTFHDNVVAVDGLWIDMNEVPLRLFFEV
jgi:alpha-glucosidase (family GH31 glycosyl hydrolase)